MPSPDRAPGLDAAAAALAAADGAVEREDLEAALAAVRRIDEALATLPSVLSPGDVAAARDLAAWTDRAVARIDVLLALAREEARVANATRVALRAARPAPERGGIDLSA